MFIKFIIMLCIPASSHTIPPNEDHRKYLKETQSHHICYPVKTWSIFESEELATFKFNFIWYMPRNREEWDRTNLRMDIFGKFCEDNFLQKFILVKNCVNKVFWRIASANPKVLCWLWEYETHNDLTVTNQKYYEWMDSSGHRVIVGHSRV